MIKIISEKLERLKLYHLASTCDDIINDAKVNNISYEQLIINLLDSETQSRDIKAMNSLVRAGAFPYIKTLDDYDFSFQPNLDESYVRKLETLEFMDNVENIIMLGTSGVGKTHIATSLGIAAAKSRKSVYFIKCHDLILQLHRAKLENTLESRMKHFTRYKLLIIDEIGYLPITTEGAKLLFQLIDMRYEKKSTIVTSNYSFLQWNEVFEDSKLASAIVDRLIHHSHVISIDGNSYRTFSHIQSTKEDS